MLHFGSLNIMTSTLNALESVLLQPLVPHVIADLNEPASYSGGCLVLGANSERYRLLSVSWLRISSVPLLLQDIHNIQGKFRLSTTSNAFQTAICLWQATNGGKSAALSRTSLSSKLTGPLQNPVNCHLIFKSF